MIMKVSGQSDSDEHGASYRSNLGSSFAVISRD